MNSMETSTTAEKIRNSRGQDRMLVFDSTSTERFVICRLERVALVGKEAGAGALLGWYALLTWAEGRGGEGRWELGRD